MVTTKWRNRARQPNSFVIICMSRKPGRSCLKILVRSKKLVRRLKAQKDRKGIGCSSLAATKLSIRDTASAKLTFLGRCSRVTLHWRRKPRHRANLHRRKQSIQHNSELQIPQILDIHSIQASFLHQLENAGETTANPESCQDHFVSVIGDSDNESSSHKSHKSADINSCCVYGENDIDNLFSVINL